MKFLEMNPPDGQKSNEISAPSGTLAGFLFIGHFRAYYSFTWPYNPQFSASQPVVAVGAFPVWKW